MDSKVSLIELRAMLIKYYIEEYDYSHRRARRAAESKITKQMRKNPELRQSITRKRISSIPSASMGVGDVGRRSYVDRVAMYLRREWSRTVIIAGVLIVGIVVGLLTRLVF